MSRTANYKFLVLIIIMFIGHDSFSQYNNIIKPDKFPELAIMEIDSLLSEVNQLDTVQLLDSDFKEFSTQLPNTDEEFQSVNNDKMVSFFNYIYVKNTIHQLKRIELKTEDEEIISNILFVLQIELTNRPISRSDLRFVYYNWDLFKQE